MNILLLGDSHGVHRFVHGAMSWANKHGIERVIQVGDFGFWPRGKRGQEFLKACGNSSVLLGVDLYFIDGNHEDHDELNALEARHPHARFMRVTKRQGAPIFIRRGARFEWDGVTFGAFGGAFSIDRGRRVKYIDWFPQEVPDPSKIAELGKVDVLLTHDSPVVPEPYLLSGQFVRSEDSMRSQATIYEALRTTQPDLLVHGHWHVNWQQRVEGTTVLGLAHDGGSLYSSAAVYSTEDRQVYSIAQWEYAHE